MTTAWLHSESSLKSMAADVARVWRTVGIEPPLVVGLQGDLGAGKTTWVRALLAGLGYVGNVPSPTYTLLEHYECESLEIVHLDLYRLGCDEDLENIGIRDWLARDDAWILAEWPQRAPHFAARCDLLLDIAIDSGEGRRIHWRTQTERGRRALAVLDELFSNYQR